MPPKVICQDDKWKKKSCNSRTVGSWHLAPSHAVFSASNVILTILSSQHKRLWCKCLNGVSPVSHYTAKNSSTQTSVTQGDPALIKKLLELLRKLIKATVTWGKFWIHKHRASRSIHMKQCHRKNPPPSGSLFTESEVLSVSSAGLFSDTLLHLDRGPPPLLQIDSSTRL